jgi:hypothetical protein
VRMTATAKAILTIAHILLKNAALRRRTFLERESLDCSREPRCPQD